MNTSQEAKSVCSGVGSGDETQQGCIEYTSLETQQRCNQSWDLIRLRHGDCGSRATLECTLRGLSRIRRKD